MPQRNAFFLIILRLINLDYLLLCLFFLLWLPADKWLFYAFYCNRLLCFLFIRSNLYSCPPENVKSQAYVTLVRPCLEYSWSVWDPHTQKHCQDIEGVQRQARQICKKKSATNGNRVQSLISCAQLFERRLALTQG